MLRSSDGHRFMLHDLALLDPTGLGPLPRVPLVPPDILRRHHCLRPTDDRFKAAARLLQALWREDRNLPPGTHTSPDGKRRLLGSRLSPAAGRAGAGFLAPEITVLVHRELAYREIGAVIDPDRLFLNLLSSQQLTFNCFAPLKLDLALATGVFRRLLPEVDLSVTDILFEHAPGRRSSLFTGDSTAFDLLVRYRTARGGVGFVAIEIKYSEGMVEPLAERRARYDELSGASRLFVDSESEALRKNPLQQLWREHLLAQSVIDQSLYSEGVLVLIGPQHNWRVQRAGDLYRHQLDELLPGRVQFMSITLEQVIAAIASAGNPDHARQLYRRYCDFWLVDGEIELAAQGARERAAHAKCGTESRVLLLPGPNTTGPAN